MPPGSVPGRQAQALIRWSRDLPWHAPISGGAPGKAAIPQRWRPPAYGCGQGLATGQLCSARASPATGKVKAWLVFDSGVASFTQVRIRGGEASHTLILIDGIEAAGGHDEYILSGLDTANIDRIEVLRGTRSGYYGENASAVVVNIITRKGSDGLQCGGEAELASLDGRLIQQLEYQDSTFKQDYDGSGWITGQTRKLKYRARLGLDGQPPAAP